MISPSDAEAAAATRSVSSASPATVEQLGLLDGAHGLERADELVAEHLALELPGEVRPRRQAEDPVDVVPEPLPLPAEERPADDAEQRGRGRERPERQPAHERRRAPKQAERSRPVIPASSPRRRPPRRASPGEELVGPVAAAHERPGHHGLKAHPRAFSARRSNSAGGTQRLMLRCCLVGRMYWPSVTKSTPATRAGRRACARPRRGSRRGRASARSWCRPGSRRRPSTRRSTWSDWRYLARASRTRGVRRSTVSRLWARPPAAGRGARGARPRSSGSRRRGSRGGGRGSPRGPGGSRR